MFILSAVSCSEHAFPRFHDRGYIIWPATTAATTSTPPTLPILLPLAPETGTTVEEGVEAGFDAVDWAVPDRMVDVSVPFVTTTKGCSVQDVEGSAERVTISTVEEVGGQPLQVTVEMDSAA